MNCVVRTYGTALLLGAFKKLRKATISFLMSVCPSKRPALRTEPLCSQWTDSREI
jgi:hypothetical protein